MPDVYDGLPDGRYAPSAVYGAVMAAQFSLLMVPWFLGMARVERGVRTSLWWPLLPAVFVAAVGASVLLLEGHGWPVAFPFSAAAMGLAAGALVGTELLAPLHLRQALCNAALETRGQVSLWTRFRGAASISPVISNRLLTALAEGGPITPVELANLQGQVVADPGRRVLDNAIRTHWRRLQISHEAEPILGCASGSLSIDPALRKPVVSGEKLERAHGLIAKGLTVREAAVRLRVGKTALYATLRP